MPARDALRRPGEHRRHGRPGAVAAVRGRRAGPRYPILPGAAASGGWQAGWRAELVRAGPGRVRRHTGAARGEPGRERLRRAGADAAAPGVLPAPPAASPLTGPPAGPPP